MGRPAPSRGFTVTELMIAMAILGVLLSLAVVSNGQERMGARSFAERLSGECETARMRAMSTRRWHRVLVSDRGVYVDQATTTGMIAPTAFEQIAAIGAPSQVQIVALATTTAIDPGAARADGDGFDQELRFAPDGSSISRTVWVSDRRRRAVYRVAIYGATGQARVFEGW
jgi:prepilin-type N-terminal cleavage/methylation domain-containing protein